MVLDLKSEKNLDNGEILRSYIDKIIESMFVRPDHLDTFIKQLRITIHEN